MEVVVLHYHGTPITPRSALYRLAGRHFCVSYSDPRDVEVCHQIGQSVMLDNGAFSFWTRGKPVDWAEYIRWASPWLEHPTTWAVIPDVIDGSEHDNMALYCWVANNYRWFWRRAAPVWHMHESIAYLVMLCRSHERVCIGSSGEYRDPGTTKWGRRLDEAMAAVECNYLTGTKLHMLRAMSHASSGRWPFASADSTNVARNHHAGQAEVLAARVDAKQAPGVWKPVGEQLTLL